MTQTTQLTRVKSAIAPLIRAWFDRRQPGDEFHIDSVARYVKQRTTAAPGSPDRVMRAMREAGEINYEVIDRGKSLYRVVACGGSYSQRELF